MAHCQIAYWKYEDCEQSIKDGFELLGIDVKLDGKTGRRTKWQTFDLAQLVVDVKTRDVELKKLRDLEDNQAIQAEENSQYVKQDDESILWEQPQLNEYEANTDSLENKQIMVEDQILL